MRYSPFFLLLVSLMLFAGDETEKTDPAKKPPVDLSGFIDVQGHLNDPDEDSGFLFNQAALYMSSKVGAITMFLDLPFALTEEDDVDFDSGNLQAYLSGDYDSGLFWQFGLYDSIIGYEDNDSVGSTFAVSSSFVGAAFESTIMGLLVGYEFSDSFNLSLSLGNPSGSRSLDGQELETGLLAAWDNDRIRGYLGILTHDTDLGRYSLLDFTLGKTFGPLDLDLEAVYLDPENDDGGLSLFLEAIYANGQRWSPALRMERVSDQLGNDKAEGATAGLRVRPYENVMVKMDLTYGRSRQIGADEYEDFTTLALAAIYRF